LGQNSLIFLPGTRFHILRIYAGLSRRSVKPLYPENQRI
jgi:hypothetical protein